jgi:hypothetical protein
MQKGLRAQVHGTVVTVDPPVLNITSVQFLMAGEMGCMETMDNMDESTTDAASDEPSTTDASGSEATAVTTEAPTSAAVPLSTWLAALMSATMLVWN